MTERTDQTDNPLTQLRQFIITHYDLEELRTLCFDLGVRYDELGGEGLSAKVRELVLWLGGERRLDQLLKTLRQTRPDAFDQAELGIIFTILDEVYATLPYFADPTLPAPGDPPFKGLEYFDVADAHLFFGREALTAQLVSRLHQQRFLAVVGASGSGKSSIVRAGIIHALQQSEILTDGIFPPAGSPNWPIHITTPTAHPLKSLAASLTRDVESKTATDNLIEDLVRSPRSLDLYVHKLLSQSGSNGHPGDRLLLVVDQFEELFTLCQDEIERRAFIDNLLTATVSEPNGPIVLIVTLRADFYAHCAQYDNLRQALAQHQEYIGQMTLDELHRAIEQPATQNNWKFELGLVDLLLRDVGDEPGRLPLLSHALLETWKRRQGRNLTLAGYHDAGGVHGAIAHTADIVYHQLLTPQQQPIARNIFLRLTELGEGTQDTRRRVALAELTSSPEDAVVLKILTDARLITTSDQEAQVAHEALIREWPRLRHWLDEDREGLRIRRRLAEAAAEWGRCERDESYLYHGARLAETEEWTEGNLGALNALELEFLEASRAAVERIEREREAARRRELEQAQALAEAERQRAETQTKSAQRLRRMLLGLVAMSIFAVGAACLATGAAGFAFLKQRDERNARLVAEERGLIVAAQKRSAQAEAFDDTSDGLIRSALLAVDSLNTFPTFSARQTVYEILDLLPRSVTRIKHSEAVLDVHVSPDGKWAISGSLDGITRIWETATGKEITRIQHNSEVFLVAFSPDGKQAISASTDGTVWIWDTVAEKKTSCKGQSIGWWWVSQIYSNPSPSILRGFEINKNTTETEINPLELCSEVVLEETRAKIQYGGTIRDLDFSGNQKLLVTGGDDGSARVWDVTTGQELTQLSHNDLPVSAVALSPDGRWVASGAEDGEIRIWEISNGKEITRVKHDYPVTVIAFSSDNHRIISGDRDGTVRVWETMTGNEIARTQHEDAVTDVEFTHDGQWILTGSVDGVVQVVDVSATAMITQDIRNDWVNSIAFSPDGKCIASGGNNTARVLNIATGEQISRVEHANEVKAVSFSPDSKWIISGDHHGTIKVWDITTGETVTVLDSLSSSVLAVAINPDRRKIISADSSGAIVVWDIATGQETARIESYNWGWSPGATDIVLSLDGQQAVVGGRGGVVRVWDIENEKINSWTRHRGDVCQHRYNIVPKTPTEKCTT